ncbi:hypothetical protein J7643_06425 [bacterium]|nr:hypothetical protein [bacterium]
MKRWRFYSANGFIIIDAELYPVEGIEENLHDPDLELSIDNRNEITLVHERLARTERKGRTIALSLLEEVASAWQDRLYNEHPSNTWTMYVIDEECGTYKSGKVSGEGGRATSLYFFNRHLEPEQLQGEIRVLYHSRMTP